MAKQTVFLILCPWNNRLFLQSSDHPPSLLGPVIAPGEVKDIGNRVLTTVQAGGFSQGNFFRSAARFLLCRTGGQLHMTEDFMLVEKGIQPGPGKARDPAGIRYVSRGAFHEFRQIEALHLGQVPVADRPQLGKAGGRRPVHLRDDMGECRLLNVHGVIA